LIWIGVQSAFPQTNDLLAFFRLNGSALDSAGQCAPFELKQTSFVDGSLYCNGCYENSGTTHGYHAIARIPKLSYDAFTLSLDFNPISFTQEGGDGQLLYRIFYMVTGGHTPVSVARTFTSHDPIIVAGESYRWFGLRCISNHLQLTLNNQSYEHSFSNAPIELNHWHNVICSFDMKVRQITVALDGRALEPVVLPKDFQIQHADKTGDRLDKAFCLQNYSYGGAFFGFANNLKVFAHPYSTDEIRALYVADEGSRKLLRASADSGSKWLICASGVLVIVVGVVWWMMRRQKRGSTGGAQNNPVILPSSSTSI
jgi:hypothetical protein